MSRSSARRPGLDPSARLSPEGPLDSGPQALPCRPGSADQNIQGEPRSLTAAGPEAGGLRGESSWALWPASPQTGAWPRAWQFT